MRTLLALAALGLLAACGADGEPTPPPPKSSAASVTLSGTAEIGVSF
jgi:predicted small lipoprotein YifL